MYGEVFSISKRLLDADFTLLLEFPPIIFKTSIVSLTYSQLPNPPVVTVHFGLHHQIVIQVVLSIVV
jgi:hypothetical protein